MRSLAIAQKITVGPLRQTFYGHVVSNLTPATQLSKVTSTRKGALTYVAPTLQLRCFGAGAKTCEARTSLSGLVNY